MQQFITRVSDVCKQQWLFGITQKHKLRTYATFKSLLEPEKYLSLNCNVKYIVALARLRCSSVSLAIEEGRRQNVDVKERICTFCNSSEIEDEYHFVLVCPFYRDLREEYLPDDFQKNANVFKFIRLMKTKQSDLLFKLCKFVYNALCRRKAVPYA